MQLTVRSLIALTGLAMLTTATPVRAYIALPPPVPFRVQQAENVIVGRVVGLLDQDVQIKVGPKGRAVTYRVAVLTVTESIKGHKGGKTIQVGFVPSGKQVANPGVVPIRRPLYRSNNLSVGMHGMFFLKTQAGAKFYAMTGPAYYAFVPSENEKNFKGQVQLAKLSAIVASNPAAALAGKNAEQRFLAAAMLLEQYRRPVGRPPYKQVQITTTESKLILNALLRADWKARPSGPFSGRMHPYATFLRLGLSKTDGWTPPKRVQNVQAIYDAARTWLRRHSGTYRIKKYASAS